MAQIDRFGTGSITHIMLEFAVPAIVGILVNAFYNIIDSIFLGQAVGELGLAATTVALPTMIITMALSMFIGVGGNSLAAIKFGEGRKGDAEKVLGNSFTLFLIMGVIVALIGFLLIEPLLAISGSTPESHDMSKQFIQILCVGSVCQSVGFGMNNFIRTAGAPNRALLTMVIGAVFCTIFNYLFVMVLGWGVRGSALATVLGMAVSAVTVLQYFLSERAPFRLIGRNMRLDGALTKQIILLGLAPFVLQLAAAIVNIVLNNLLGYYGALSAIGADGALASLGVVSKVAMIAAMPAMGISQAAQPLLGYNYGARFYPRVLKTFKTAAIWATVIITITWALVQIFPSQIIGVFGIQEELLTFSISALRVYSLALPIVGAQIVGSNYFQATGQPLKAAILSMTRQLLFLIPLFYILPVVLPGLIGVEPLIGICAAAPASDVLAFITTFLFDFFEISRIRRLEREQAGLVESAKIAR